VFYVYFLADDDGWLRLYLISRYQAAEWVIGSNAVVKTTRRQCVTTPGCQTRLSLSSFQYSQYPFNRS